MHARKDSGCHFYAFQEALWANLQNLWKAQKQHLDEFQQQEETKLTVLFSDDSIDRLIDGFQTEHGPQPLAWSRPSALRVLKGQLRTLLSARLPECMTKPGFGLPDSLPGYDDVDPSSSTSFAARLLSEISQLGERCRFSTVETHLSAYATRECGFGSITLRSIVESNIDVKSTMIEVRRSHEKWLNSLTQFQYAAEEFCLASRLFDEAEVKEETDSGWDTHHSRLSSCDQPMAASSVLGDLSEGERAIWETLFVRSTVACSQEDALRSKN